MGEGHGRTARKREAWMMMRTVRYEKPDAGKTLREIAGCVTAIAVADGADVQSVDYEKLAARLEQDGQVFK
jgi:hypothetical protein